MRNNEIMLGIYNAEQQLKRLLSLPENIKNSEWVQKQIKKAKEDRFVFMGILIAARREQAERGE